MTLFDDVDRSDGRPATYSEDNFSFLNRVDGPLWEKIRVELEAWFAEFPQEHRDDLRERFRSADPRQHFPAWWELYLFHLFRRLGFDVEVHPDAEGVTTHPDFRLRRGSEGCYVEAVTVFSGIVEEGRHATREGWIKDLINEVDNRSFFVSLDFDRVGTERPSRFEVVDPIKQWLDTLDADVLSAAPPGSNPPSLTLRVRDWVFTLEAFGISPERRDDGHHRLLGAGPLSSGWVDDVERLGVGLKRKLARYGTLDPPLVVAVLGMSSFVELRDVEQVLFGREAVAYGEGPPYESRPIRQRNGVWMTERGPSGRNAAAVLSAAGLHPWTCARQLPHLWLNPWAAQPFVVALPFPSATADDRGSVAYTEATATAATILGLPDDWPGPEAPFE